VILVERARAVLLFQLRGDVGADLDEIVIADWVATVVDFTRRVLEVGL
jgi:hypothetical protein